MALSLTEARELISNSTLLNELNNLEVKISYPHLNHEVDIKGLYNIYEYFYNQFVGWESLKLKTPEFLNQNSYQFYKEALIILQRIIKDYLGKLLNLKNVDHFFKQEFKKFINSGSNHIAIPYNAPEIDFLIKLNEKRPELVLDAYRYIIDRSESINSRKQIEASLLAYEFQNKRKLNSHNIWNNTNKIESELEKKRIVLENDYQNEIINRLADLKKTHSNHIEEIETFKITKEKMVSDWFINAKGEFEEFSKNSKKDINNIQESYRKKVELDEPIKYWSKSANSLRDKGRNLLTGIIGIALLFSLGVYLLLWYTPADLLKSIFSDDPQIAIRWSIIFVIFVTIFFVVIKALLKFMFSNFHLARDAEEREKLTYLYLSMIEKGAIDKEERKIILQSLFSRSETGLLKDDSSPTMPNISNYFSNKS